MICKNCKNKFKGNFCNYCGQNSNVQKINSQYLVDEISNSVLQVNRGILFTIKELFIRPGHSIREFLEGKRKPYYKPLAFILLTSVIYGLLTYFSGKNTFLGDTLSGLNDAAIDNASELSITNNLLNWLSKNFAYSTLLLIPFFSLASYLCFVRRKYNYFEHLVLNCYITGQQTVIYVVCGFILFITNNESYFLPLIPVTLSIIFTFLVFIQFFETKRLLPKILLTVFTYFLYLVFITIMMLSAGFLELFLRK